MCDSNGKSDSVMCLMAGVSEKYKRVVVVADSVVLTVGVVAVMREDHVAVSE